MECSTWMQLQKRHNNLCSFPRQTIQYLSNPSLCPNQYTEEAEVEWFYECEVKWALESITTNKASGGDGIPVELFQILKDDAVKVPHSLCQQIWKTQQWPQDWKKSVFFPTPKKGNAKECSN